jgi:DNA-binding CsgD family transcriptional regulator
VRGDVAVRSAVEALRAAGTGSTWLDAARAMATAVGADAAGIVIWDGKSHEVLSIDGFGFSDSLASEYQQEFFKYDRMLEEPPPPGDWQVSDERFPDVRWSRDPYFGDYLHRHCIGQVCALTLRADSNVIASVTMHRHTRRATVAADFRAGVLGQLTQEATMAFSVRYDTAQAVRHALQEALDNTNAMSLLVDTQFRVQPLSTQHPLLDIGPLMLTNGRLAHRNARAQRRLQQLVARAAHGARDTVIVPGPRGVALRIEAMPLPKRGRYADAQTLVLVRIERRGTSRIPAERELHEMFDITPMQARVLRLLCEGMSAADCAERMAVSMATVRTHIAQLMLRMDCRRQAQLVQAALLLS